MASHSRSALAMALAAEREALRAQKRQLTRAIANAERRHKKQKMAAGMCSDEELMSIIQARRGVLPNQNLGAGQDRAVRDDPNQDAARDDPNQEADPNQDAARDDPNQDADPNQDLARDDPNL